MTREAIGRMVEQCAINAISQASAKAVEFAHARIQERQTLARTVAALEERVRKLEAP